MSSKFSVALCVAFLFAILFASQGHAKVRTSRIGAWKITQHYDRYTGINNCEIKANRVRIENGVAIFRIKRKMRDDPIIRIDGLVPRRASEYLSEIRLSSNDVLDDVNSGDKDELYLPLRLLANADHVFIRSGVHEKIKKFKLKGISQVIDLGQSEHCGFAIDRRQTKPREQLLLNNPVM